MKVSSLAKSLYLCAVLLMTVLASACSDNEASRKPELSVSVEVTDIQKGKSVKNGMLVLGKAIFPRNVQNHQIKPAALDVLQGLKKEVPGCDWFTVWISDDERSYESGNYIAIAEYKEGKTTITGGVPTDEEMQEYLGWKLGPIMKPTDQGLDIILRFTQIKVDAHWNKKQYLSDGEIYPLLSKEFNLPVSKIKEIHQGVSRYYMYKIGKDL